MIDNKRVKSEKRAILSLILDVRRKKSDGLYPLKIRVYDTSVQKNRYYGTGYDMDLSTYKKVFESPKPKRNEREIREEIEELLYEYKIVAQSIENFTHDIFEEKLFKPKGEPQDAFYQYNIKIEDLKSQHKLGSISCYKSSFNSLKSFLSETRSRVPKQLHFSEITPKFLQRYEKWMLDKGKSRSTVGIYLRPLRHLFNVAKPSNYPFGKDGYVIPKGRNKKKAINKEGLKLLFETQPENEFQQKAKDFWFFSYLCKGMNMKDILYLKWEQVKPNHLEFVREKTKTTTDEVIVIRVPLTDFSKGVIEKYSSNQRAKNDYIFPVLNHSMNEEEKFKAKQNFTRLVNQHMKRFAKHAGFTEDISTYWARHSFATMAIRKNASIEYVGESLGHADIRTTKSYIDSIMDEESEQKLIEGMMDFD
ncbi:tyrosine-type recombinase/integrase [Algoriphagus yeomjeoni]|uniref:Site-specific recombinase XerD n=1 Tax=Algoriphagus yeomjeoni TaxID=291403 RepID=A0A327P3G5_9BACT|nr:site-specific integrase [Algoriphagus yeomjeoni]RAI86798.1 site-specific recombinase XerD [Algoriphagus yeomjeoni]